MGRLVLGSLLVSLLGCAAQGPPIRPQDLPFHGQDQQFFNLHWRVDREDGVATAVGVVEAAGADRFSDALLELQGLDKDGRIVSRGFGRARPMAFQADVPWPFTVRLRVKGQEERFALRVSDFTFKSVGPSR